MKVRLHYAGKGGKWRRITGDAPFPPRVGREFRVNKSRGGRFDTVVVTEVLEGGRFRTDDGQRYRVEVIDAKLLQIMTRKALG